MNFLIERREDLGERQGGEEEEKRKYKSEWKKKERKVRDRGSVWDLLILLKLKTFC